MLFTHSDILTMDSERRVIRDGAILVEDGRITAIGKTSDLLAAHPDEPRRDLRGMALMPGLVNTHVHLAQCLMRGIGDDLGLRTWLLERIWPSMGNYREDDNRVSAELCLVEMLKSGTTTFLETFLEGPHRFDGVIEAVVQSGMRAGIAKCVMDTSAFTGSTSEMHPGMVEGREESIAATLDLHERWSGAGDGRVQIWFGPRPPGGSSESLFREIVELSRQHRIPVNMHLAEDLGRVDYIREHYDGATPIEFCERVGLLGPDVVLVHAVNVTAPGDLALLAASGTHLSHNPASNSKLGMGVAPLRRWLEAGINVALGTDASTANNTYDLVRDFRWASYLHKAIEMDPTFAPAELVLEMATRHGARALGLDHEIGSLEVGKKADFIALDLDKPHFVPAPDLASAIAWCATGADVDLVVIDGRVVVDGGEVTTLDEHDVMDRARRHAAAVRERAGLSVPSPWPHI